MVLPQTAFGQKDKNKKPLIDIRVRKMGPYFGLEQGKYLVGEMGGELQFKKVKLVKPKTHAIHFGANYNIPNNVLGFSSGYWFKPGRFDLTFGADLAFRSNFDAERIGAGPVLGYKIFGFHLRVGYIFLTPSQNFIETNELFINLRFTLINNRDVKWKKRKKKK